MLAAANRSTFLKKRSMSTVFDEVERRFLGGDVGRVLGAGARVLSTGLGRVAAKGRSRPGRQARPEGEP
jgi:hypothetical protein